MPTAEIITIGTEILLGEILDTNAPYIARTLREIGIDLYRMVSVGDNIQRISQVIQQACERADIIITTGGLGPTVDDPTRDAVALAFDVPTEYRPELWEQIQTRFQAYGVIPTENNKRQAHIPKGAIALENPVGTAPAFIYEKGKCAVIALPGVPREMEYLLQHAVLPYIQQRHPDTGVIKSRILHIAGVGESHIDSLIGDLETYQNPTVGLAAHAGQVDVRITAKAATINDAEKMIEPVEETLRQRLGAAIYGVDQDTLEQVALLALKRRNWHLAVVEAGLDGRLTRRLSTPTDTQAGQTISAQPDPENIAQYFLGGEVLPAFLETGELQQAVRVCLQARGAEVGLGVSVLLGSSDKQEVFIFLQSPDGEQQFSRSYGGPPKNAPKWAVNTSLNLIRNL